MRSKLIFLLGLVYCLLAPHCYVSLQKHLLSVLEAGN